MKILVMLFISLLSFNSSALERNTIEMNKQHMANQIEINGAWARATFALAKTGAAYMSLKNISEKDLLLVSVSVPESVARDAQLHHTIMEDDMMRMQELEAGVRIESGGSVEFMPGGKHIMLMGLTGPLVEGQTVVITFEFEDGSVLAHSFMVKDASNAPKSMSH